MRKLLFLLAFVAIVVTASAQSVMLSSYSLPSDTVINAGTTYLTSPRMAAGNSSVAIQVVVTKVSGTIAGTISLQGSLDNVNFKAAVTPGTQTAVTTVTAADASTNYIFYMDRNPYTYYRVSWTGASTMNATFTAKIITK